MTGVNGGDRMVAEAVVKIYRSSPGKHQMNLRSDLVADSTFPFKVGEELLCKIVGNTLVIRRHVTKK